MGKRSRSLELKRLNELRKQGVLSEAEFQLEKRKVLEDAVYYISEPEVKRRGGCLKTILIAIVLLTLYLFISEDKRDTQLVYTADTTSSETSTPEVTEKECIQISKDLHYFYKMVELCSIKQKMPEFKVGFTDRAFFDYRERVSCPTPSLEQARIYRDGVIDAVEKGLNKSGSLKSFCQNEIPYFNKIVQKYGS